MALSLRHWDYGRALTFGACVLCLVDVRGDISQNAREELNTLAPATPLGQ